MTSLGEDSSLNASWANGEKKAKEWKANAALNRASLTPLISTDRELAELIRCEAELRAKSIPLIASENFPSPPTSAASALPPLAARNMEGYADSPFYQGEGPAREIETLAIKRATALFDCQHANVQPFSGSLANAAAMKAVLPPKGGRILCMSMADGGHFTHGSSENISTQLCEQVANYATDPATDLIDYEAAEQAALKQRPHLIIVGGSNYARKIDFKRMGEIRDAVNAEFAKEGTGEKCYLMADIAHYAGLIAAKEYPNPFPHADLAVTTTHKTLRGPRGGLILWNDDKLSSRINNAVFPGVQGEPNLASIAAKAVAFKEAASPEFKSYTQQVLANATALEGALKKKAWRCSPTAPTPIW